ncbi:hypothetical protein MKW98_027749 [Papaver atlanticum]|uniref:Uncharacterized protein n=1 Tax=Papaver atlanticum TaxID=357466 RepID=A0AAD4XUA5_9MAGN|nr:hypothetical protein MKW98_027749 [Papaver atlanticum]
MEAGAIVDARDHIELGTLHPFDAVVIPARKFDALMDKLGVYPSYEKPGVYPHHLQRFTEQIESLEECVDETMAFGEYVAAGKTPYWDEFVDWYNSVGRFSKGEIFKPENESDTLPTARDQIAMPVGDVSAVVAENLADNTNKVSSSTILTTIYCFFRFMCIFCFIYMPYKLNQVIYSVKYSSHYISHTTKSLFSSYCTLCLKLSLAMLCLIDFSLYLTPNPCYKFTEIYLIFTTVFSVLTCHIYFSG